MNSDSRLTTASSSVVLLAALSLGSGWAACASASSMHGERDAPTRAAGPQYAAVHVEIVRAMSRIMQEQQAAFTEATALCLEVEGSGTWIDPPGWLLHELEDLSRPVVPRSECARDSQGFYWASEGRHDAYVMSLAPIRDGRVEATYDDGSGGAGKGDTLGGSAVYVCRVVGGGENRSVAGCEPFMVSARTESGP